MAAFPPGVSGLAPPAFLAGPVRRRGRWPFRKLSFETVFTLFETFFRNLYSKLVLSKKSWKLIFETFFRNFLSKLASETPGNWRSWRWRPLASGVSWRSWRPNGANQQTSKAAKQQTSKPAHSKPANQQNSKPANQQKAN